MSEVITTAKQALEETVKMWKWIVKNTASSVYVTKEDYLRHLPDNCGFSWDDRWINDCPCCEFVGYDYETDYLNCKTCPINAKAWGNTYPEFQGEPSGTLYACEGIDSPYNKWHNTENPKGRKLLAKSILLLAEIALKELLEKEGTND